MGHFSVKELQTALLREKFVIHDPASDAAGKPVVALSNRIEATLADDRGQFVETLVVRAQNMHSCVRMTARIVQTYMTDGRILTRKNHPFDWAAACDDMQSDYEQAYNPQRWVAIYNRGSIVFSQGVHHPFLDIIEKCQAENRGDYDRAIPMAEATFKKAGTTARIDYDGNVALNINLDDKITRFGVIVRAPDKTRTFSYSIAPKAGKALNFPQCMGSAAAFLEGIQLAFMVGINEEKIRIGLIDRHSKEERMTQEARQRLNRLDAEISTLERDCEVRYRPEKPEFPHILADADKLARATLAPRKRPA